MSYELTILRESTYLHAIVTGTNSRDNVISYLQEIRRQCLARNCRRVLIEERLKGPRLGMVDVFRVVAEGSGRAEGALEAIAFVDIYATGGLMKFAETVAVNRALPVTVFYSVRDAEDWLQSVNP